MAAYLTGATVEFAVLGPLLVQMGGDAIDLAGIKEREVLAYLLLRANETVSADRLIDAMWPDDPPATARNSLQVRISHLRKALGADRIETVRSGYRLRIEATELDLSRFRRLVAEARQHREAGEPAFAAREFSEALALWRGRPLPELAENSVFNVEIERLEEERLSAFEDRIDTDLELGEGVNLVGELQAAVAANPLRERLMGQLMVALYRAGRQVQALETFGDARRRLVHELGLEPGPLLRDLHQRILAHDPALTPARAMSAPTALPSRRTVTVALAAWTVSDDLDPEVAERLLANAQRRARDSFEDHGAIVSAAGDSIVATFGLPSVREDDPFRAIRAASELSAEGFRLALDTGVVLASEAKLADSRFVGRLLQLVETAAPGDVVLGTGARAVLADAVELRGSRLISFDPTAELIERHFDAPLIGREHELKRLCDSFAWTSRNHRSHLVTIIGPAGIGKSRLVRELIALVREEATVLTGRCLAHGSGAFWPLGEMVRQAAGDTTPEALARVLSTLEDRRLVVDQLAAALGTAKGPSAEDAFWAFRKLFMALAAERPLLLVFEDMHWAEERLLAFIEDLVRRAEVPILAASLARPDLLEEHPGWGGAELDAESLRLAPLSVENSAELIRILGGGVSAAARARIASRAEGNPLFIEQLVALAAEDPSAAPDTIPMSLHGVLAARVDRLAAEERALLELASIVGLEFSIEGVATLWPDANWQEVARVAGQLVRKDLLNPVGPEIGRPDEFRFRHILIRDVVYGSILKARRAELHERFARWLERVFEDRASEVEAIGYHLERCYLLKQELELDADGLSELANEAGEHLARAGKHEFDRSNATRAIDLLERALRLLDQGNRVRGDVFAQLSFIFRLKGEWSQARQYLNMGFAWAESARDDELRDYLKVSELQLRLHTEPGFRLEEFVRIVEDVRRPVSAPGSGRYWPRLQLIAVWPYALLGKYEDARRLLEDLQAASPNAPEGRNLLPSVWLDGPIPVPLAISKCEALLSEDISLRTAASCYRSLAVLRAMLGQFREARQLCLREREILDELGLEVLKIASASIRAAVELLAGESSAAELSLRTALREIHRFGSALHAAGLAAQLARCLLGQERIGEAWRVLESGTENSARDVTHQVESCAVRSRLLAARGHRVEALRLVEKAVAIADSTDSPDLQAGARVDHACILQESDPGRAERSLGEALRLYGRKGNLVEERRVGEMLKGYVR